MSRDFSDEEADAIAIAAAAATARRVRREQWTNFFIWLSLATLECYVFFTTELNFDKFKSWAILFGAVLFPVGALHAGLCLLKGWNEERANLLIARVVNWVVLKPIIWAFVLALIALGLAGIVSLVGWFSSIPAWAAVIIILLLIKR